MALKSSEIITLQIGSRSNYVGCHWWNLQEAGFVYNPEEAAKAHINHDVTFWEGLTPFGNIVTYTPRLISVDLKGSLNNLPERGVLYETRADVELAIQEAEDSDLTTRVDVGDYTEKNEFLTDLEEEEKALPDDEQKAKASRDGEKVRSKLYDLDDRVSYWSDFQRTRLHPKSVAIVDEFKHDEDKFHMFGSGEELYERSTLRDELEDRMHFFSEECDCMQGFHLLSDTHDGFGGVTSAWLDDVVDDFPKKGILAFTSLPDSLICPEPDRSAALLVSLASSWLRLSRKSDLTLVPMTLNSIPWSKSSPRWQEFPHLDYKPELLYHQSAIMAAAVDTATLSYRVKSPHTNLSGLCELITPVGRKVASLQCSLPFPLISEPVPSSSASTPSSSAPPVAQPLWTSLSPIGCSKSGQPSSTVQSAVLRGIQAGGDALEKRLAHLYPKTMSYSLTVPDVCHTQAPYPNFFSSAVMGDGVLGAYGTTRPPNKGVRSVPILSSLQSTPAVSPFLTTMCDQLGKVRLGRHHDLVKTGMDEDGLDDLRNGLMDLAEHYDDTGKMMIG